MVADLSFATKTSVRDLEAGSINPICWETITEDHISYRLNIKAGILRPVSRGDRNSGTDEGMPIAEAARH